MSSPELIETCRYLRQHPTPAEDLLWQRLRNKQLNGLKFRRQHPVMGFILDFYCPQLRLGIELYGAVHKDENSREYDLARTRILAENGIRVLRFWNAEVLCHIDSVLLRIRTAVDKQ